MQNFFDDVRQQVSKNRSIANQSDFTKKFEISDIKIFSHLMKQHANTAIKTSSGQREYFYWIYINKDDGKFIMHYCLEGDEHSTRMDLRVYSSNPNIIPKYGNSYPVGFFHYHPGETIELHALSSADKDVIRKLYSVTNMNFKVLGLIDGIVIYSVNGGNINEIMSISFEQLGIEKPTLNVPVRTKIVPSINDS